MNSKELEFMVMNLYPHRSMDEVWQDVASLLDKQRRNIRSMNTFNYYWVTINPKPDITLDKFITYIEKVVNRRMINKCVYSFEQRGETEQTAGNGLHCHLLCETKVSYNNNIFAQRIRQLFVEHVGNINTHVHIIKIPSDWKDDKIEYIRGLKWDPDKEQKINIDRIWRMEKGLQPYYSKAWDFSTSV